MSATRGFLRGQDAWRRHPIFSWGWKEALPGIREGTALFGLYCAFEWGMSFKGQKAAGAQGAPVQQEHLEPVHKKEHH